MFLTNIGMKAVSNIYKAVHIIACFGTNDPKYFKLVSRNEKHNLKYHEIILKVIRKCQNNKGMS